MSKSNVLELARELVAAIEKEDKKNKVMLKDIPVGGKFDTGIGRFIVLEQKENYTAVITEDLYRDDVKFDDDCTEYRKSSLRELCEVFGKHLTKVRPLTFDEAREYNDLLVNKDLPDWYWTCTSWSTKERGWEYSVAVVSPSGGIYDDYCSGSCGVRPFCIFSSSIFESCEVDDD